MTKFNFNQLLMRGKDLLLLIGAVWAIFLVGVRFYNLPATVEAQAANIRGIQINDTNQTLKIQALEQGQGYLIKNTDEIKESMKAIWRSKNGGRVD